MFWKNRQPEKAETIEFEKREKLFFHDIINHTHGLLLFLNLRHNQNRDIPVVEISMLEQEVRALQSLIKDHFHLKHKNLTGTYDWVPFHIAEVALNGLIQTYLPGKQVKTFVHLAGLLAYDKSLEERECAQVYFPVFYRVMNNLIKNMAEAKSSEVHFYFNYGDEFHIETRNIFNSKEDLKSISEKLSQIILDEKPTENGLGLESIHHLTQECGGGFEFEIHNGVWINHISLPLKPLTQKKAA